jgi:hypothetical protein
VAFREVERMAQVNGKIRKALEEDRRLAARRQEFSARGIVLREPTLPPRRPAPTGLILVEIYP